MSDFMSVINKNNLNTNKNNLLFSVSLNSLYKSLYIYLSLCVSITSVVIL